MSDSDEEDQTAFISFEGLGREGEDVVLSRSAFMLYSFGLVNGAKDGHPRFVSDDYLNAISAETTLPAAELCVARIWRRAQSDDGYDVLDQQAIDDVVEQLERLGREPPDDRPIPPPDSPT